MEETEDPWAELRNASKPSEAGRFSYNDKPTERAQASAWDWIKLWLKEDVLGWFKKQLPPADETLDSSYYLGINRRKKVATNAVKVVLGKEPVNEIKRTPVVLLGRRIGIPGLIVASFTAVVLIAVFRSILNL